MGSLTTVLVPMRTRVRRVTAIAVAAVLSAHASGEVVLYVNQAAPPGGDGLSWATAFGDLQEALAAPVFPPADQIWVAQGAYKPHKFDKNFSFELRDGLTIYGGFAGGENSLDQRDPAAHPTVLSGDLKGNDGPDFTFRSDNSFHIVNALNAGPTAVLDGLVIRAGNADGNTKPTKRAGGLMVTGGGPTLRNCLFDDNHATLAGGAVYLSAAQPVFESCRFVGSVAGADGGAAILAEASTLTAIGCAFEGGLTSKGGAILLLQGSGTLTGCTFTANQANSSGSGVNVNHGVLTLDGCTFSANTGAYGAAIYARVGAVTASGCVFEGNSGILGGAVHMFVDEGEEGSGSFDGCTFTGNQAQDGPAFYTSHADATITNSTFRDNKGVHSGAVLINNCAASVRSCEFTGNSDNFAIVVHGPEDQEPFSLVSSVFTGNTGGLIMGSNGLRADVIQSTFVGNGHAVSLRTGTVSDCLFIANQTFNTDGAALSAVQNLVCTGSTFFGNTVQNGTAGGIHFSGDQDSVCSLVGNVLWWNWSLNGSLQDRQVRIVLPEGNEPEVRYNTIQDWTGDIPGEGNSAADPLFIDWLGADNTPGTGDEDLHLAPGSPCVDAGDSGAIPADTYDLDGDGDTAEPLPLDADGNPRFVDDPFTVDTGVGPPPIVDRGCFEAAPPPCVPDFNKDGVLDIFDFFAFVNLWTANDPAADLAADGMFDIFDFLMFQSAFVKGCS
jgi:hypothetical protein